MVSIFEVLLGNSELFNCHTVSYLLEYKAQYKLNMPKTAWFGLHMQIICNSFMRCFMQYYTNLVIMREQFSEVKPLTYLH